jgi:hypothetical protein
MDRGRRHAWLQHVCLHCLIDQKNPPIQCNPRTDTGTDTRTSTSTSASCYLLVSRLGRQDVVRLVLCIDQNAGHVRRDRCASSDHVPASIRSRAEMKMEHIFVRILIDF